MKKKIKVLGLCAMLFAFCVSAQAQQPKKVPLIGSLSGSSPSTSPARHEAFRQGLRDLGYVEGKNIVIERRWADGKFDRLPALVAELVRLKVDIIVTAGPQATRPAKQATSTIPIVMAQDPDPVGNGFVASLARPGGNITGLSTLAPELNGKKLEILKEVVPRLSRVAVLMTSTFRDDAAAATSDELKLPAAALKVKIQYLDVLTPADFENAFKEAIKGRADGALMEAAGPVSIPHRKKTAELAVIINLKAAKQIGLTIPPNVLARADRVIR